MGSAVTGIVIAADKNNAPIREALRADPTPPPARPLTDLLPTEEDIARQEGLNALDEWGKEQVEDLVKQGYNRKWAETSMALAKAEMKAWSGWAGRPPLELIEERPLSIGVDEEQGGLHQGQAPGQPPTKKTLVPISAEDILAKHLPDRDPQTPVRVSVLTGPGIATKKDSRALAKQVLTNKPVLNKDTGWEIILRREVKAKPPAG